MTDRPEIPETRDVTERDVAGSDTASGDVAEPIAEVVLAIDGVAGRSIRETADSIRTAVAPLAPGPVHVTVEDVVRL